MSQIMKRLVALFAAVFSYYTVPPKMQPVRVRRNDRRQ